MTDLSALFEAALAPHAEAPLYRRLYGCLRDAVLEGRLSPGERLPSSRTLAASLGCSRNTVMEAFDLLRAEGYLEGRTGAGSFVSTNFSDGWVREAATRDKADRTLPAPRISRTGRALLSMGAGAAGDVAPHVPDPGGPDLSAFPFDIWARTLSRVWRRPDLDIVTRGDPMGYRPLRAAIADYLQKVRALRCGADRVMIVSGAQHGLDLVVRMLIDPGGPVWIEDPSYRGARAALLAAGAKAVPVPVGSEGFDTARGTKLEPTARVALVTPSHQFPLGVTMSLPHRMELLEWAEDNGGWIVEDDFDSEFRYSGRPIPALHGLDRAERVIYVGTFSKAMFPSLRLGYVVLPESIVPAFRAARVLLDGHTTTVSQLALAEFFAEGQFTAHLRRMRALYRERRDAMRDAVQARLSSYLDGEPGEGGMHLLAHLRAGLDDVAISRRAREAGIACPALSSYYTGPGKRQGLVIGFAGTDIKTIPLLVERLAAVMA